MHQPNGSLSRRFNKVLVAALIVCIVSMILVARNPQEAVIHVVIVDELTRDRAPVVDCNREGAAGGDCACSRRIKLSDGAIAVTHEAVKHSVPINKKSRDIAR